MWACYDQPVLILFMDPNLSVTVLGLSQERRSQMLLSQLCCSSLGGWNAVIHLSIYPLLTRLREPCYSTPQCGWLINYITN
jgi:hypothetical protein